MWECVACLELAANVAAPWVDPQMRSENGAWVEMTRYDGGRANRFYESSHKWSDERFGVLSGHRFGHAVPDSLIDVMRSQGVGDERIFAALTEAERATAAFLRTRFTSLAGAWKSMRGYAGAFEHGLLFIPSTVGSIVDANDDVVPHAILVWETRKEASLGHVGDSIGTAIDSAEYIGELAIDLAHHVSDARLRLIETLEFEGDAAYLAPWEDPFPYWFNRADVSPETLEVLQGFRIVWVREEADGDDLENS
jgi:hypothetical protein